MSTTISTGQLRQQLADALNRASYARDRIVVERNGRPVAAIVSLDDLHALEAIEDAADARAADEAKAEGGVRPLTEFLDDLDSERPPEAR